MSSVRHCIVTEEYSGVNRSGGIGACSNGLAGLLIRQGLTVDVLITDLSCSSQNAINAKKTSVLPNFIFLSDVFRQDRAVDAPVDAISKAFCVYRFLKDKEYEVLHFNEWMGSGFFCAMARRQGLLKSRIVTHLHGSSEWVRRHNLYFPEIEDYEREGIENSQIENSDIIISPSNYLLEYYRNSGLSLPTARKINWVLPQWVCGSDVLPGTPFSTRAVSPQTISELIFFGRHERRKGFDLFVDAVARMPKSYQPDLTFIGRFDRVGQEFSGSYVFRKLPGYAGRIRFYDHLDQEQALSRILHSRAALCVMPSLIENSPCVIGECLTIGAPFLTTDVGGVSELIASECQAHCMTLPTPQALAEALYRCWTDGLPSIRSSFIPKTIAQDWREWLGSLDSGPVPSPAEEPMHPLVSICMAHYERPATLRHALEALMSQTYDNIEIIIVDDGSERPDAHAYLDSLESRTHRFPIKVVRSKNKYLGAARNLAASHAKGEYVLFHDDDNFAEPTEVETFVAAAQRSGCDILTSQYWVFRAGEERLPQTRKKMKFFPIGIGGVFSFFRNRFGDANALIRRSAFEALGGFTELHGVGWEDWELFLRAFLRGVKMGIVPEPLFNYRLSASGMLATGNVLRNHERLFALVDEEKPRLNADLLRYAQRRSVGQQVLDQLWSDLERSPASDIHQQLIPLDPASVEARRKLSDLAFTIGRVADAIEIGVMDYNQREKMLALASGLARPSAQKVREKIFVTPSREASTPAVALRGWAYVNGGKPIIPRSFVVDEEAFETIAYVRSKRPDVIEHHNLSVDEPLGFTLFGIQKARGWRGFGPRRERRRRIPTTTNFKVALLDNHSDITAHIDEIEWCCEVTVRTPEHSSVASRVSVDSARPTHVLLKGGDGSYAFGERLSPTIVCFDIRWPSDTLTFILPRDEKSDIIFETLE
ncbi:glycosyltransferase [Methylocystis sp. 9N]|uniref:Glycosyltransferase n=1 Tax=Methylocystis borbori TaxID=3118750 RepID=A0ABU7XDB5_9HYPH